MENNIIKTENIDITIINALSKENKKYIVAIANALLYAQQNTQKDETTT